MIHVYTYKKVTRCNIAQESQIWLCCTSERSIIVTVSTFRGKSRIEKLLYAFTCALFHFWFDFVYFYLNSQQPNALSFSYASNVRFYGNSYLSNTNSLSPLSLFVMSKLVTVQWFSVEIGLLQYLMKILYDEDNFRIW